LSYHQSCCYCFNKVVFGGTTSSASYPPEDNLYMHHYGDDIGTQLWAKQNTGSATFGSRVSTLVMGDDRNVYVYYGSVLRKYDPCGNVVWSSNVINDHVIRPAGPHGHIKICNDGETLYLTTQHYGVSGQTRVHKYDTDGNLDWSVSFGKQSSASVYPNAANEAYVATKTNTGWPGASSVSASVFHFDTSGNILHTFDTETDVDGEGWATTQWIELDSSGNPMVCAYRVGESSNQLWKLTTALAKTWGTTLGNGDYAVSITCDDAGNVYVASQNGYLQKFNGSGSSQWDISTGLDHDTIGGIDIEHDKTEFVWVAAEGTSGAGTTCLKTFNDSDGSAAAITWERRDTGQALHAVGARCGWIA